MWKSEKMIEMQLHMQGWLGALNNGGNFTHLSENMQHITLREGMSCAVKIDELKISRATQDEEHEEHRREVENLVAMETSDVLLSHAITQFKAMKKVGGGWGSRGEKENISSKKKQEFLC